MKVTKGGRDIKDDIQATIKDAIEHVSPPKLEEDFPIHVWGRGAFK